MFKLNLLILFLFSTQVFGYVSEINELTLGREFTAVAGPMITPKTILKTIANERGGEIYQHRDPRKWKVKDDDGFKWSAEIDGRIFDEFVFEVQTPPLKGHQADLMLVPFNALIKSGARPYYSLGGGHIHIDIEDKYRAHPTGFSFLKHPKMMASLMNLLLTYEETLTFIFRNFRRDHTTRKLSELRQNGKTLAQILGHKLNLYLKNNGQGCEDAVSEELLKRHQSCIVSYLEHFARNIVPTRETDINLQAWKGSSAKKTHGTLELRFFNAPKTKTEVILEEKLVRSIADFAFRSNNDPVFYQPKVKPIFGENAYIVDYKLLKMHFGELLKRIGLGDLKEFALFF